jgi:hypothetical protein
MNDALVDAVLRKLCVTYDDPDVYERIVSDIMPSAEQDLKNLLGIKDESFDFSKPGSENHLFINWCYYEYNGALDDFETHYALQIGRCRDKWMVKQYAEEKAAADV